jgi:hypothetical protein
MQCYNCGHEMAHGEKVCTACGRPRSRLIYAPFCGVLGGIVASIIGFTLYDVAGALIGGLLGILIAWFAARSLLASADKPSSVTR